MKYSCAYKCPAESAEWKSGKRCERGDWEGGIEVLEGQRLKHFSFYVKIV
jgi:hypothetical protein